MFGIAKTKRSANTQHNCMANVYVDRKVNKTHIKFIINTFVTGLSLSQSCASGALLLEPKEF